MKTACIDNDCYIKGPHSHATSTRMPEDFKGMLVLEWLGKHTIQYVGDTEDLSNVCLDGWFNLEELVNTSRLELIKELREKLPGKKEWTEELMEEVIDTESYLEGYNAHRQEVNEILNSITNEA